LHANASSFLNGIWYNLLFVCFLGLNKLVFCMPDFCKCWLCYVVIKQFVSTYFEISHIRLVFKLYVSDIVVDYLL